MRKFFTPFYFLYRKLVLVDDTPHRIALGAGIGIFTGVLPGVGPLAALALAFLLRANRAAALMVSLFTNTWFTLITLVASIKIGAFVLGNDWNQIYSEWKFFLKHFQFFKLFESSILKILLPVILGYIILALIGAVVVYLLIRVVFYMQKRKKILLTLLIAVGVISLGTALLPAADDSELYSQARSFFSSGEDDFGYLQLTLLLEEHPESRFAEPVLFGIGEYNFKVNNPGDARKAFEEFLKKYPSSPARPFAYAYLISLARKNSNLAVSQELEKELVSSQQLSLIFRDRKEKRYRSVASKKYRALLYINKAQFYADGALLVEVSY